MDRCLVQMQRAAPCMEKTYLVLKVNVLMSGLAHRILDFIVH
jgi:hypothetical protein